MFKWFVRPVKKPKKQYQIVEIQLEQDEKESVFTIDLVNGQTVTINLPWYWHSDHSYFDIENGKQINYIGMEENNKYPYKKTYAYYSNPMLINTYYSYNSGNQTKQNITYEKDNIKLVIAADSIVKYTEEVKLTGNKTYNNIYKIQEVK